MSPDIPSSMRLMMTVRGTCVAVARYASVASPNVKAMGRPTATPRNTATTKNRRRFSCPNATMPGRSDHSNAASASAIRNPGTTSRRLLRRASAEIPTAVSMTAPTSIADVRQTAEMPSPGSVTMASSTTYSNAGKTIAAANNVVRVSVKASSRSRQGSGRRATRNVRRRCSPRRSAMTAPSVASHRNRMDASSSAHVIGRLST
jgi:hypothetical protein